MNAGCKSREFLVQHQKDYYFDMRALSSALIRKSSQKAGCIFLSPASHCCHARHAECTINAACDWDIPSSMRAARISVGVG